MGQLGLKLITGPANAGKVALLLRRYLEALAEEPYLIVPNRSDVERVERDLLELQPALLGGSIGTFDDLFRRIARGGADLRPVATEAQRALLVRRALAGQSLNGLGRSARFGGFADSLLSAFAELESGLLDPNDLDGELAALYAAYRAELDRRGLWDQDLLRRHAAERVANELVGEELLSLIRSGTAPEQVGIVCPSLDRWQAPLVTALGTLGVPFALEGYVRLDKTAYGQAL